MKNKYVTFDAQTEIVWGVGTTAEESLKDAKFTSYDDDHGGFGYEFACWCSDLSTVACSDDLYRQVKSEGRLSVDSETLRQEVVN